MQFTLLALTLASSLAFAADDADFAARKKEMIGNIDKNIVMMQDHRKCVEAATTPDGLRPCMEKAREARKNMRGALGEGHMTQRPDHK